MPIISVSGDCIGSIVIVAKENEKLQEGIDKILKVACSFLESKFNNLSRDPFIGSLIFRYSETIYKQNLKTLLKMWKILNKSLEV